MNKIIYIFFFCFAINFASFGQASTGIISADTVRRTGKQVQQDSSEWIIAPFNRADTLRGTATAVEATIAPGYTITKDTVLYDSTVFKIDTVSIDMRQKAINVGVRGGVNFSSMNFKGYVTPIDNILDADYKQDGNKTGFVFGIFAEIKTGANVNWLSLQPEFLYVRRGFDGDYTSNNALVYRCEETIDYFEGRLGFLLKPFAFLGKYGEYFHFAASPYVDFSPRGSVFAQSYTSETDKPAEALYLHGLTEPLKVGDKGHITSFDIGIGLGIGFKIPVPSNWLDFYICGDLSFDFGLLDNHPIREIETGNPARYNKGTMLSLGLSVPIYQPRLKETKLHTLKTATYYDRIQPVMSIKQVDTIRQYGTKITQIDTRIDTVFITKHSTVIKTDTMEVAIENPVRYFTTEDLPENPCNAQLILILATDFEHSKSTIAADMQAELNKIAAILNSKYKDYSIEIYGHTDSSGSYKYPKTDEQGNKVSVYNNLILSEERASVIANYLGSKIGKDRVVATKGYGYSFPLVKNVAGNLVIRDNNGKYVPYELCADCKPKDDPKRGVIQKDRRTEIYVKCYKESSGIYERE